VSTPVYCSIILDDAVFTDKYLKLARGGELPRLRETALDALLLGYDRELTELFIVIPWNMRSLLSLNACTPGALNWRSVYGLAVAAAWCLYRWCRL